MGLKASLINGPRIEIEFHHDKKFGSAVGLHGRTEASVRFPEISDTPIVGVCVCGVKDVYVKEVGRKKALARALEQTFLSREQRREVWQFYFNRIPKKEGTNERTE